MPISASSSVTVRAAVALVEDLLADRLDLVFRRLIEVVKIVGVEQRHALVERRRTALHQLDLAQPTFQPFASAPQRLVDGLGGGGQAALQDGQREADRSRAPVVLERLGPVELLADVFGDRAVQAGFGIGELVGDGVGHALREEGTPHRT